LEKSAVESRNKDDKRGGDEPAETDRGSGSDLGVRSAPKEQTGKNIE
jgi:hypothetical protein